MNSGPTGPRRHPLSAADHGARLIVVDAEPTPYDGLADEIVPEAIGSALPKLLAELRAG
ncbi:hypothetical protein ABZ619_21595 [Streptomyces sp. NPDC007851]|uniref:hypothetical protein n=1 Tax=Streptomyces sp. NPDC007851 TaxID=3155008 RepID=UPI0033E490C5